MSLREVPNRTAPRTRANRLNALKSTGPRSKAGKFRSALNLQSRRLVPEGLERELRARGEDPREFCRLQRDLVAIFHPYDATVSAAVTMLARAWWQEARRIRQWVGAGTPTCPELDARIEGLLVLVVDQMRAHHQHWMRWLAEATGSAVGRPAEVRQRIEHQLALFGAKPGTRKYRLKGQSESNSGAEFGTETGVETGPSPVTLEAYIEAELRKILAENIARNAAGNGAGSEIIDVGSSGDAATDGAAKANQSQ